MKKRFFLGIFFVLALVVVISAVSWNDAYQTPKYFIEDEFSIYNFS